MANPEDVGTFDLWITGRVQFGSTRPKADDTGDFDRWITDRISFETYQVAADTLTADQGSYTLLGQTASLLADHLIAAAQGSYVLTGYDAVLGYGFIMVPDSANATFLVFRDTREVIEFRDTRTFIKFRDRRKVVQQ